MSTFNGPATLEWSMAYLSLAGGAVVSLVGASYGLTNVTGVGAGFFPCVAGALVALAGLMWVTQLAVARKTAAAAPAVAVDAPAPASLASVQTDFDADDEIDEDGDETEFPDKAGWIRVGIIVASVLVAALLLNLLGYTIAMTLMLGTVLFFVSKRPWWLALVVALGAALASRLVFEVWLGTALPTSSIDLLALLGV